jgi:hypothetical protein
MTNNAHLNPGDRVADATSRRVRDPAEQKPDAVLTLRWRISPPVQLDVVEPVNIRTQFDNPLDEHQLLIAISLFSASSSEVRRGQRVQKPSGVFMGPVFPPFNHWTNSDCATCEGTRWEHDAIHAGP